MQHTRWRDYRDNNRHKTTTLEAREFIRRFLIHVMPDGFHRIRYYGFLGNTCLTIRFTRDRSRGLARRSTAGEKYGNDMDMNTDLGCDIQA
jgi:hypothetical protein